jgi:hypothetical protein
MVEASRPLHDRRQPPIDPRAKRLHRGAVLRMESRMQPATRHAIHAAVLLTLIALGAPAVGAQRSRADSLLTVGASVRYRTNDTGSRRTETVIVARRGDTLDVRISARRGTDPTVREQSLDWRTLHRLEARSVSAADGPSEGAFVGFALGASIGAAAAKPSTGSLDFRLSTNPGFLALAGGLLGGLVGFMVDASSDSRPWVSVDQP